MTYKEKRAILNALDDSRRGEVECGQAEDYDDLIYQGWVEALEFVIALTGQSEKKIRKELNKRNK